MMWSSSRYSSHGERRWREQRETEREESKNDRDKACKDETFTVKRRLWRKITINLVKSWSENTPALPDCRADSITFLLIFFLSLSESTALSKSPPDFQLLSLVVVPDKQNLLDQADFTAAPAHMAASVAHSLSWGLFFFFPSTLPPLCLKFTFLQIPTPFSPPIKHQVLLWLYFKSFALRRNQMKTQECIKWVLLPGVHVQGNSDTCGTQLCHSLKVRGNPL